MDKTKKLLVSIIAVVLVAILAIGFCFLWPKQNMETDLLCLNQAITAFSGLENGELQSVSSRSSANQDAEMEYIDQIHLLFSQQENQLDYLLEQESTQQQETTSFCYKSVSGKMFYQNNQGIWEEEGSSNQVPSVLAEMLSTLEQQNVKKLSVVKKDGNTVYQVKIQPSSLSDTIGGYQDISYIKTYTVDSEGMLIQIKTENQYVVNQNGKEDTLTVTTETKLINKNQSSIPDAIQQS